MVTGQSKICASIPRLKKIRGSLCIPFHGAYVRNKICIDNKCDFIISVYNTHK